MSGPKRDDLDGLILNSPNLVELDKTLVQSALVNLLIMTNASTDIVGG